MVAASDYVFTHYTVALLGCKDGDGNDFVLAEHAERLWLPQRHDAGGRAMLGRDGLWLPGGAQFIFRSSARSVAGGAPVPAPIAVLALVAVSPGGGRLRPGWWRQGASCSPCSRMATATSLSASAMRRRDLSIVSVSSFVIKVGMGCGDASVLVTGLRCRPTCPWQRRRGRRGVVVVVEVAVMVLGGCQIPHTFTLHRLHIGG